MPAKSGHPDAETGTAGRDTQMKEGHNCFLDMFIGRSGTGRKKSLLRAKHLVRFGLLHVRMIIVAIQQPFVVNGINGTALSSC